MECNSALLVALLFITIQKFLQYSESYHDRWLTTVSLYNTSTFKTYREKLHEQKELTDINNSISAQDNYAKWTKNNRKLEKLSSELKELKEKMAVESRQLKKATGTIKLLTLKLPFLVLKLWKGKEIVYYLPSDKLFPFFINGVLHQGWLFLAMRPLQILLELTSNFIDLSFVESKIKIFSGTHVGVSLAIWIFALGIVLDSIEFIVKTLVLQKPVAKPVKVEKN